MSARDVDYFRMRAEQERKRAEASKDTPARRVHLEMAERYSEMLRNVAVMPRVQA
jgi:hypothetical protein